MHEGDRREQMRVILAWLNPEEPEPFARADLAQHTCAATLCHEDIHPPEEGRPNVKRFTTGKNDRMAPEHE
jgi:hypothetical protein